MFAENFRGNALVDRRSTSEEEEIERWVRHYDKLMVVCSQAGLDSETVRNDLTAAKDLQQSQDKWIVYLVDPDGTLDNPRARSARNLTYEHVIFDMRGPGRAGGKLPERLDQPGRQSQTGTAGPGRSPHLLQLRPTLTPAQPGLRIVVGAGLKPAPSSPKPSGPNKTPHQ